MLEGTELGENEALQAATEYLPAGDPMLFTLPLVATKLFTTET